MRSVLAGAALALALLRLTAGSEPGRGVAATVAEPVDGDTVKVVAGGRRVSVRLLGIDTPETHRPGRPVECGGPEASAALARIAPAGTRVWLEPDPTQDRVDRYGRLLAYVRLVDGRLLEDEQLRAGWAAVYVYAGRPVRLIGRFRRGQDAARSAGSGVWGECGGRFHSIVASARLH
jgi:micrococcal nuclease